jgi:hypothetical protein
MHLLAPAGKVVLTPGVALKIVTNKVVQNYLSCFCAIVRLVVILGGAHLCLKSCTIIGLLRISKASKAEKTPYDYYIEKNAYFLS